MDHDRIEELIGELEKTEAALYEELSKGAQKIRCDFAEEKIPLLRYIAEAKIGYVLTAPVIYAMIVPALIMDLFVSLYQAVCFPVYGIPKARREEYIVFDRHRLKYLNILQKLNCLYCAYFNGLVAYVREIASRTEQFWCPIRHARRVRNVHRRYWNFLRYGDGKDLRERWHRLREDLKEEEKR
ncbi:hypothetical protein [Hydrogenimonas sp.]